MMMMLNDVLDLSKIESRQFTIDHAPVDLHATLAECAALHRQAAETKGLTLEFARECRGAPECAPDVAYHPFVVTDGLRLRQIVLNLLGNAVKFTEAGSIRLAWQVQGNEVRITVSDTGIGISEGRLETIFQPFIKDDSSTARRGCRRTSPSRSRWAIWCGCCSAGCRRGLSRARAAAQRPARRHQAVEAVRTALRDGSLAAPRAATGAAGQVTPLLHKLAGTAAMFREAELGESAAALERALGMENAGATCVTLARELLALADRPADARMHKVGSAAG